MKQAKKLTARAGIIILLIAICSLLIVSCGDSSSGDNTSPGHTHVWEWKVTTPATAGVAGVETETCICGATKDVRPIPALDLIGSAIKL